VGNKFLVSQQAEGAISLGDEEYLTQNKFPTLRKQLLTYALLTKIKPGMYFFQKSILIKITITLKVVQKHWPTTLFG